MEEKNICSMQNVIGGKHRISPGIGALSMVRKLNAAHAYLILEKYEGGARQISDMHLVVKRETENAQNKKADIVHRDLTIQHLLDLQKEGLHSVTWSVTQEQMNQLESFLDQEKERVANNEIDYHLPGKVHAAGVVGASLQVMHSEEERMWSVEYSKGSVSEYLLRSGHNCYSWAQAMVLNIGVNPPTRWQEFFVKDPREILKGGAVVGEQVEPTTNPGSFCCLS